MRTQRQQDKHQAKNWISQDEEDSFDDQQKAKDAIRRTRKAKEARVHEEEAKIIMGHGISIRIEIFNETNKYSIHQIVKP